MSKHHWAVALNMKVNYDDMRERQMKTNRNRNRPHAVGLTKDII